MLQSCSLTGSSRIHSDHKNAQLDRLEPPQILTLELFPKPSVYAFDPDGLLSPRASMR